MVGAGDQRFVLIFGSHVTESSLEWTPIGPGQRPGSFAWHVLRTIATRRLPMKRVLAFAALLLSLPLAAAEIVTDGVVVPVNAANQILIPAAGSVAGGNGTFFRSDVTIVNFTARAVTINVRWLPQPGGTPTSATLDIAASSGIRSSDFVHDYLNQSGLGAILLTPVTGTGSIDTGALLNVTSRIWTPQPGTAGATSQNFPGIPTSAINTPSGLIFGMGGADAPDRYRVNVGIVNLSSADQDFVVTLPPGATSYLVHVPALGMQQIALGSGFSITQQIQIQNGTPSGTRSNNWVAYGSTVDNVTGDAWSDLAIPGQ
jgi:hypothetical protein